MAIAFDSVTDGGETTGTSLTYAHTAPVDNPFLVADVVGDVTNDTVTGVTYAGEAMTLAGKSLVPGNRYHYLWYKLAPTTGANNVVVTSGSSVLLSSKAATYTGANQSAVDSLATANTASNSATHSISTTVAATSWLIGSASINGQSSGGVDAGADTTERDPGGTRTEFALFDTNANVSPGSRALNFSADGAGTDWAAAMLSIAPAGAVAAVTRRQRTLVGVGQ